MTYLDLIRDADRKLDTGQITLGEYERMIEPLKREVQPDPDWTLCSKELPKDTNPVNICTLQAGYKLKEE